VKTPAHAGERLTPQQRALEARRAAEQLFTTVQVDRDSALIAVEMLVAEQVEAAERALVTALEESAVHPN
jgi:hypothetical protein